MADLAELTGKVEDLAAQIDELDEQNAEAKKEYLDTAKKNAEKRKALVEKWHAAEAERREAILAQNENPEPVAVEPKTARLQKKG